MPMPMRRVARVTPPRATGRTAPRWRDTDQDAERVQQARGDDEAQAVEQRARAFGQLAPVRVPVEDCEAGDDRRSEPQRRTHLRQHHRAQHDRRDRDADLDTRHRDAEEPHQPAERHHQRKRHWQHPDSGSPKHRAPQSHGHHRQHMIQARDGMGESGEEARGLPPLLVGQCGKRRHRQRRARGAHRNPMEPTCRQCRQAMPLSRMAMR